MELLLRFAAFLSLPSFVSGHSLVALVTLFSSASDLVLRVASCFEVGLDVKIVEDRRLVCAVANLPALE